MTTHTRTNAVDLEIRSDGRTIVGIAMPFDRETRIAERGGTYTEVFRRGAFARTIAERGAERVKLLVQHNREALPIGRATLLREDAAGLYGEFRVSETRQGDEVLALVRDGALDGLSVGFRPVLAGDRWNAGRSRVERTEVKLPEVSVVSFAAYEDAQITGVRSDHHHTISAAAARRRLHLIQETWT